jgi:hypothetical protein
MAIHVYLEVDDSQDPNMTMVPFGGLIIPIDRRKCSDPAGPVFGAVEKLLSAAQSQSKEAIGESLRSVFLSMMRNSPRFSGPRLLHEDYGGGPYATKMLCREAFESPEKRAAIPAAILRARLTNVTSPAERFDSMDGMVDQVIARYESAGKTVKRHRGSSRTDPMTVEEALWARYSTDAEKAAQAIADFRAFVELAEAEESRTGKPCWISASEGMIGVIEPDSGFELH